MYCQRFKARVSTSYSFNVELPRVGNGPPQRRPDRRHRRLRLHHPRIVVNSFLITKRRSVLIGDGRGTTREGEISSSFLLPSEALEVDGLWLSNEGGSALNFLSQPFVNIARRGQNSIAT